MNELIREIEEDIRQERLDRLWQSLGKFMVGASVMVVLATIVFEAVQHHRQTAEMEMTSRFLKGVDRMNMQDYKGAIEAFSVVTDDTSSPYYGLCMMEKAQAQTALSDTAAAAKTYDDLASKDPVFGKLAEVLKSSQGDTKTINNTPLSSEPFYFTRGEWRGWQLWQQGRKDEAISQFLALYNDPAVPHTMRSRLSEVLHHIAPDKLVAEPLEPQGMNHE